MIPQRILVKGFLCYQDEQTVCFDGCSLWMLAGPNGSGKSTVFDAVTYALFGAHRATGQKHAQQELINKESDGLVVEFDFLLDHQLYQARRTLRKTNRSTRQIRRWQPAGDAGGQGVWDDVPGTDNDTGFRAWVREHIGLTYETFTSSMLLMQGKADNLLVADPRDRHKVLAGIVGLDRYERLHERANERRRELEIQAKGLQHRLAAIEEVGDAELEEAARRIATAETGLATAEAEVQSVQRLELQAEQWATVQARLAQAQEQWRRAQVLLQDEAAIAADWSRLETLRGFMPHLGAVVEQRERIAEVDRTTTALTARREDLVGARQRLDGALEQARHDRQQLERDMTADDQRRQEVGSRLVELSGLLARVGVWQEQCQERDRLEAELAGLPSDPRGALDRERREHDRLAGLGQALSLLGLLHDQRDDLEQARGRAAAAAGEERAAAGRVEQLASESAALARQVEAAAPAARRAEQAAAEARALLAAARDRLDQFNTVAGAQTCQYCGQPLSPEHIERERARLETERADREEQSRRADNAGRAATRAERDLQDRRAELDDRIARARDQVRTAEARREQAEDQARRHTRECGRIYRQLPEPFRARVAPAPPGDWTATTYPAREDLDDAQRQVLGLAAAQRRLEEARAALERWTTLQAKLDTTRAALAAQEAGLPGNIPDLCREHGALVAEDAALQQRRAAQQSQLAAGRAAVDRLSDEREAVQWRLADTAQRLSVEATLRATYGQDQARARAALPAEWQVRADQATAADVQRWRAEQADLEQRDVPGRYEALRQVRADRDARRRRLAELEHERDQIPPEARRAPAEVRQRLALARDDQARRGRELRQAQQESQRLVERREARRRLQEESKQTDRQQKLYGLLTKLLGREGLQSYLRRQAECGIVDYANAILDRLSGGQLYLQLRGDESGQGGEEKALQLEAYNRAAAGRDPIHVAFLSGSQRFRVAVSLALGIGQYASRQHRPIESVIIDEGFGCLDREGRQVMIQELQNLRGQLRCILLVSHQEEFADAFPDGYRFEIRDGTTVATRFQR